MRRTIILLVAVGAVAILIAGPTSADFTHTWDTSFGFQGTTRSASGFIPPDTMGAVGRDHIVELVNGAYRVYDKSDGSVLASTSLNTFWTNAGVSYAGSYAFDPRIVYDPSVERWYASSVDNAHAANNLLFAVSLSDNPLDGWSGVSVDSDTDNSHWADFDTLGFGMDAVYVAANMFTLDSGSTETALLKIDKAPLLGATPSFSGGLWQDIPLSGTGFAPQPVLDYDNTSSSYPLLGAYTSNLLLRSTVDGTNLTVGTSITTATVTNPPDADQPGDVQNIETNDFRICSNVVLVNGSMWGTQSTSVGGRAAIRWFEIDASTNAVLQDGVIADDTLDLYFPSIAVTDTGFVAIGCSGSSSSTYASGYVVTGETSGGVTTFGDLIQVVAGTATYVRTDSNGRNRWGDYSATVIDPYDPLTFWTFQEYAYSQNEWATWIQRLDGERVPEPGTIVLLTAGLAGLGWLRRRRPRW